MFLASHDFSRDIREQFQIGSTFGEGPDQSCRHDLYGAVQDPAEKLVGELPEIAKAHCLVVAESTFGSVNHISGGPALGRYVATPGERRGAS